MLPTSDPADPAVASDRIEGLYAALTVMQVDLDGDPLELGPKRLNGKIALCRGMLSQCEKIFLSVAQDLYRYKRSLRSASADFKLKVRELLTNDPEVRMGRNVTDREAIASNKLRSDAEEIDRLTACVEDLESVVMVVRVKRLDLKDIQGRLKDQLKVCQEEIGLGGRWGSSSPTLSRRTADPAGDSVMELLEDVLAKQASEEVSELSTEVEPTEPEPPLAIEIFKGNVDLPVDEVLEELPGSVPEVSHPDSNLFTDDGIDDLLNLF